MVCIATLPRTGRPVQAGNHSKMNMNVTGLTEPGDIGGLRNRKTALIMTCVLFGLNISAAHSMRRSIGSAYFVVPNISGQNARRRKCARARKRQEKGLAAEIVRLDLSLVCPKLATTCWGFHYLRSPHEPFRLDSKEASVLMI